MALDQSSPDTVKVTGDDCLWLFVRRLFLYDFKHVFSYSAQGAYPIVGNVFKSCSGGDASLGVSHSRIIYPVTYGANVLLHDCSCDIRVNKLNVYVT